MNMCFTHSFRLFSFLPNNEMKRRMIKREENGITNWHNLSMKKEENCQNDVENNPVHFSE